MLDWVRFVLSAVLTLGGLFCLLSGVVGGIISIVPFGMVMWPMLAVFLGVGVIIGVFGGNIAIRNYLKV